MLVCHSSQANKISEKNAHKLSRLSPMVGRPSDSAWSALGRCTGQVANHSCWIHDEVGAVRCSLPGRCCFSRVQQVCRNINVLNCFLKHPEPLCSTLRFALSAHYCACACNASIDDPLTQLHSAQLARRDFSPSQRVCEMQTAWCQVTRAGVLHAPCRWQYS